MIASESGLKCAIQGLQATFDLSNRSRFDLIWFDSLIRIQEYVGSQKQRWMRIKRHARENYGRNGKACPLGKGQEGIRSQPAGSESSLEEWDVFWSTPLTTYVGRIAAVTCICRYGFTVPVHKTVSIWSGPRVESQHSCSRQPSNPFPFHVCHLLDLWISTC